MNNNGLHKSCIVLWEIGLVCGEEGLQSHEPGASVAGHTPIEANGSVGYPPMAAQPVRRRG